MSFTKHLQFSRLFLAVFAIISFLSACEEPDGIGLEVLPDGEEMPIAWVDTFTVDARTIFDDSVATSNLASTYLIGDFGDPIFGRVRSELYTQFLLSSSDIDFGANPMVDSVVLNLAYAGAYGNTDKLRGLQTFGVYRLNDELEDDSTYYSNISRKIFPKYLGQKEFRPDLYSNVVVGEDTLPPSLRMPLTPYFGQSILNSSKLSSNEEFITEFKGLCIRSDNATMSAGFGSILYFNMVSSSSRLELYYHNDTDDSLRINLLINEDCATHTKFVHDFETGIENAVADSLNASPTQLFVQSMAGTKMKLEVPHLRKLNELGIVTINKAELVIPLDESVVTDYGVPNSLQVTGVNEDGGSVFLIDFFEGGAYYGGTYDAENQEYVFNVARHLQSLLTAPEEPDYGLYVLNSGNAVNARRGVFNGPAHLDSLERMRLRMTYTIIE